MNANFESELRSQIAELEGRRVKLNAELAHIDGHLSGLRQALSLFRGEQHSAYKSGAETEIRTRGSRVPNPRKSEAWAFALTEMENAPPEGVGVRELDVSLRNAGYALSRNTLRANLSNAATEGVIERVGYGRYRKLRRDTERQRAESEISEESDGESDSDARPRNAWNPALFAAT